MRTSNQNKLEYWRSHLDQSKLYPDGIQAYCKANNLATSNYYNWRKRVLKLKTSKIISKELKSPFFPVVVTPTPEFEVRNYPQVKNLPDSRWVAEVIANVIRGLL